MYSDWNFHVDLSYFSCRPFDNFISHLMKFSILDPRFAMSTSETEKRCQSVSCISEANLEMTFRMLSPAICQKSLSLISSKKEWLARKWFEWREWKTQKGTYFKGFHFLWDQQLNSIQFLGYSTADSFHFLGSTADFCPLFGINSWVLSNFWDIQQLTFSTFRGVC